MVVNLIATDSDNLHAMAESAIAIIQGNKFMDTLRRDAVVDIIKTVPPTESGLTETLLTALMYYLDDIEAKIASNEKEECIIKTLSAIEKWTAIFEDIGKESNA